MDAKENALVAISKVPANAGHSLHKGTPREAFIKEFLEDHLPENVAIGTGEIIDSNSSPNVQRNQFDIVIYKKNYPKLDFGGGIGGFLIESVVATIEVKSTLDKPGLEQSIKAAKNSKNLNPNIITSFHSGYIPPKILNYVVAYDGPVNMSTVYGWIPQIHQMLGITINNLPNDEQQRIKIAGYLGIAQKAGRIAAGDNNVREALKKKKVKLLVLAQDASGQIKEELTLLANEQGIGIIYWPSKLDLGLVVGKSRRGAVGVLDLGFARAINKITKI